MNVTVFLGSRLGNDPIIKEKTKELGKGITEANNTLVYGGSISGLMGTLAKSVKKNNGEVIGVYPDDHFENELPLNDIDEAIHVKTMEERKRLLIDLGDIFVVMPGGTGTLEEAAQLICEMVIGVTPWAHIIFYNYEGFYDPLLVQLANFCAYDFSDEDDLGEHIFIAQNIETILDKIEEAKENEKDK